jgi:sterol desaturase/sphingolipid hydroxylase (fatty acid hydroxylase superfamily)
MSQLFFDYLRPYVAGAVGAMYLSAFVLVPLIFLELAVPARKLHLRTLLFNLAYAPVFLALLAVALHPVSAVIGPLVPENVFGAEPKGWPAWKTAAIVLAYVAMFDLLYYWLHRAQHRFPLLWRFHRFHHSDVTISASSSFRHHWLEDTFRYFIIAIPLLILFGHPEEAAPLLGLAMGGFGFFIHWNTRLDLGVFTHVLVSPRYHRLHHSILPEHFDRNFCTFFPIWDRLFGTQVLPRPGEFPETGVAKSGRPNSLIQVLPLPPKQV